MLAKFFKYLQNEWIENNHHRSKGPEILNQQLCLLFWKDLVNE